MRCVTPCKIYQPSRQKKQFPINFLNYYSEAHKTGAYCSCFLLKKEVCIFGRSQNLIKEKTIISVDKFISIYLKQVVKSLSF